MTERVFFTKPYFTRQQFLVAKRDQSVGDVAYREAHPLESRSWHDIRSGTLYDMHGNACEWCLDWYVGSPSGSEDPLGPNEGSRRVLRGGSWHNPAGFCRSAYRADDSPSHARSTAGFRVALPPRSRRRSLKGAMAGKQQ